jgi:transposase-like protein
MGADPNRRCEAPNARAGARFAIAEAGAVAFAPSLQLVKESARQLLAEAVKTEVRHFLDSPIHSAHTSGPEPMVRNGLHPQRTVLTGVGPLPVRLPKVRRRHGAASRFRSALVPPYARRALSLDPGAAALYVRAIALADVGLALEALFGGGAHTLPPEVSRALQEWWSAQCARWRLQGSGYQTDSTVESA